jgi:DNA-binding transcriptional MerR regulator/methylmalonyl-CoA mutase cobalamin-binding subunit
MQGIWRIGQFSARVGVAAVTLRAWERRYGLLRPDRTPSGYRLYTPADEARVQAMQAGLARGLAAAEAAGEAIRDAGAPAVSAPASRDELLRAVAAYDPAAVDAVLERTLAADPVAALRDVVLPALASIGDGWERRELSVAQEHMATHLVERRLLGMSTGWDAGAGPRALLACPGGEQHSLGLVCFGIALAHRGWRISYLGADCPPAEVQVAAARLGADLVVLAALIAAPLRAARAGIASLAASHRTVIAGAGASAALADEAGCGYLAADPIGAAEELAVA